MAHVEQVKAAVGEDNFLSGRAPLPDLFRKLRLRKYLLYDGGQSALHHGAQKFRPRYSGRAALHHHDAARVVGEPRR